MYSRHQRVDPCRGDVHHALHEKVGGGVDEGVEQKRRKLERGEGEETECSETLRLLEEYPEPLTMEQRGSLRRHTAALVHRFEMVRRGAHIIERGYNSLQSLLSRLEAEQSRLQSSLARLAEGRPMEVQLPAITTNANTASESGGISNAEQLSHQTTTVKEPRSATRRPGGLLRSAAFANLHSVLSAAKREQQQELSSVTLERERISRVTQLKIVEEDLAEQKRLLAPLSEKYHKSRTLLEVVEQEVLEALRLYNEMQLMEVAYASRFFLRASGSQGNDDSADSACYDIFFAPAKYTDEVQDMIREQVEEILEEYLLYRRRVDPLLESLAEERRQRDAERADQLLQLIGVDTENMNVAAAASGLDFVPHVASMACSGSGGVGDTTMTAVAPHIVSSKGNGTVAAGQVSDADDDEDDNNDGDDKAGGQPLEQKQRNQILSALAALDDFEELY